MATNIQINATTSTAVSAFNALTAAIAASQNQLNGLGNTIAGGFQRNLRTVENSFDSLIKLAEGLAQGIERVAAGFEMVFSAIVKELDKIQGFNAIMLVTTKSTAEAASSYDFLRATADKLGVQFDSLSNNYAKLLSAIPEGSDRLNIANKAFLGVAEAARTLHATNSDTQLMFYAITQMASKGVVSMEELRRQLGEKLPGAIQIAAKAINVDVPTMIKAISTGSVDSIKFLKYFGDELIRTFSDSSEKASTSVSAAVNRLTNVWVDFVKSILDSGAGNQIIGIFDALREKLSDPYVISQFTTMIGELAAKVTGFIQNLTQDDIRNGFDTFANFVRVLTTVLGGLITSLTWIIDHGKTAGAVLGAVAGAAVGARVGGAWGALGGAIIGGGAGAAAGAAMQPSGDELGQRWFAEQMAKQTADQAASRSKADYETAGTTFADTIEALKSDKQVWLDLTSAIKANWDPQKLNTKQLQDLNTILTSSKFSTESQKLQGIQDYAKTGQILDPRATGLSDVLGGKAKLSAHDKSVNATFEQAMGLDANFPQQMENLNELLKAGRLDMDQYTQAVQALVAKQPIEVAYSKQLKDAREAENKSIVEMFRNEIEQDDARKKVSQQLQDEIVLSTKSTEAKAANTEAQKFANIYTKAGLDVSDQQYQLWLKQIEAKNHLNEVQKAENTIQDTADLKKYVTQQEALNKALQDGAISRQNYDQQSHTNDVAKANQKIQQGDGDMQDAAVAIGGKLTAGYTNVLAGLTNTFGDFFTSIEDGFANSIGQAVIGAKSLKEGFQDVAKQGLAALISGLVKLGIQYVITNLLQTTTAETSLATTTATSISAAAATAAAWAPAAAAVSLASYGANAIPASEGIVATYGLSEALSAAGLTGHQAGGYTGDGPVGQIAGYVHGQEYVVNASATAKNRATLEAMNRGQTISSTSGSSGRSAPVVHIENYGSDKQFDVTVMDDRIKVIANDVADTNMRKNLDKYVSAHISNPSSKTSKAVTQNTTARRVRT